MTINELKKFNILLAQYADSMIDLELHITNTSIDHCEYYSETLKSKEKLIKFVEKLENKHKPKDRVIKDSPVIGSIGIEIIKKAIKEVNEERDNK